ncbi:MAG: acyltransferase, partial [Acetobacteraceae bacterium]|nr:acyltransferase [Acetobacteraceae bacterium]
AALALAGWAVGLRPREPVRFGVDELWRNLLLIHGWGLSDRWAWNYPSWSISTEWAGYLAFPALWGITRRLPMRLACALPAGMLLALAAAETAAGKNGLNLSYRGALCRFLPEFIAGMAAVRLASVSIVLPPGRLIALAGVVVAVGACLWWRDAIVVGGLWLCLAGLLIASRQGSQPALTGIPGLVRLGEISYSFYMSFACVEMLQAVLWRRLHASPEEGPLLFAAVALAGTLALATATWRWVERPVARLFLT